MNNENNVCDCELNLSLLLADHIGERFYSPITGLDMELQEVTQGYLFFRHTDFECFYDGTLYHYGRCMLYPSRELYEQHPLNPLAAWGIWQQRNQCEE